MRWSTSCRRPAPTLSVPMPDGCRSISPPPRHARASVTISRAASACWPGPATARACAGPCSTPGRNRMPCWRNCGSSAGGGDERGRSRAPRHPRAGCGVVAARAGLVAARARGVVARGDRRVGVPEAPAPAAVARGVARDRPDRSGVLAERRSRNPGGGVLAAVAPRGVVRRSACRRLARRGMALVPARPCRRRAHGRATRRAAGGAVSRQAGARGTGAAGSGARVVQARVAPRQTAYLERGRCDPAPGGWRSHPVMSFAWPWLFLLLPLPWLLCRLLPPAARGAALRLPQHVVLARTSAASGPPRWRRAVAVLAWALLVCAAARPQQLAPPQAIRHTGRALMLAVDCSGSMAIEDMQLGGQTVSRFAAIKAIAGRFVAERAGDDVGLILFGTHAYLLTPMTFDVETVAKQLDGAAIGLPGRETAIGDAIVLAVKHLSALPAKARVLVLLTDGVNTAGSVEPLAAAKLAEAAHVRIYTIGVGSGTQTIDMFGLRMQAPGSELDIPTLTAIARDTGGRFFRAADGDQLAAAYRAIDELEPLAGGDSTLRPRREWYPWPLGAALLLACTLLPWRAVWPRGAGAVA